MPATVAVPLVSAAIGGATSIVGSRMASNASRRAADTQAQAATRAERDTRQSTADALAYIDRMRSSGMPAASGSQSYLARLMGIPGATPSAVPSMSTLKPGTSLDMRLSPIERPQAYEQLFGAVPAGSGQTPMAAQRSKVMLRAPNGQQQLVPANQVDHFLSLGATRVQ